MILMTKPVDIEVSKEANECIQKLLVEDGNMSPYYYLLYQCAKETKNILEFGVMRGKSTRCLLFGIHDGLRGCLYSVDWGKTWEVKEVAIPEITRLGLMKYWTWIQSEVNNIPYDFTERFDLILIDLEFETTDYVELLRKCDVWVTDKGKILVHNIIAFPELKTIIEVFMSRNKDRYDYSEILVKHGLGILSRKGSVL